MGNLGCGRGQPLLELGQTLDALNRQEGTDFTLDIYTDHKYPELLERLAACPAIRMHGFVTGKAYQAAFDGVDAFVHVEAFDKENRDRVRYSVSTKIIESLASCWPTGRRMSPLWLICAGTAAPRWPAPVRRFPPP